jgi:hypothetical protein
MGLTLTKQKMDIEDIEKEAGRVTPDQASARSLSWEFKGQKLEPFSRVRQTAAEAIGVKIASTSFGHYAESLAETGSYPGFLSDAIMIVWLCSSPIHASYRAVRKPDEASTKALIWWEENGGNLGSPEHVELIEVFGGIISDIFAVQAEITGGSGSGNDSLGESSEDQSNTPPSSPAFSLL